jgi:hypothetical protein
MPTSIACVHLKDALGSRINTRADAAAPVTQGQEAFGPDAVRKLVQSNLFPLWAFLVAGITQGERLFDPVKHLLGGELFQLMIPLSPGEHLKIFQVDKGASLNSKQVAVCNALSHTAFKREPLKDSDDAVTRSKATIGNASVEETKQWWKRETKRCFRLLELLLRSRREGQRRLLSITSLCEGDERSTLRYIPTVVVLRWFNQPSLLAFEMLRIPCGLLTVVANTLDQVSVMILADRFLLECWLNTYRLLFLTIFFSLE